MKNWSFINIREIVYITGDMAKMKSFFIDFGGWDVVQESQTDQSVLQYWDLDEKNKAQEILVAAHGHTNGQIRLIQFDNTKQSFARSSQQPWDTGGVMDINLHVPSVSENFNQLREKGWHGLSDPLLQTMGPFKLYDVLMKGYDDIIVGFVHRLEPPMELFPNMNLPSHVYNSSLVVNDLEQSKKFFVDQLGCTLLNEYAVKKDTPQENMFGLPHNLANTVTCKANILSFDGGRDVVFQIVAFEGIEGKDFSSTTKPPNRGFVLYRIEVDELENYHAYLIENDVNLYQHMSSLIIEPYGNVDCFSILSPDGVIMEFFEKIETKK